MVNRGFSAAGLVSVTPDASRQMANEERCPQWSCGFGLDFHGRGAWSRGRRINKGQGRALGWAAAQRGLFQVWLRSSRCEMVWRGLVSLPAFSWRAVPSPGRLNSGLSLHVSAPANLRFHFLVSVHCYCFLRSSLTILKLLAWVVQLSPEKATVIFVGLWLQSCIHFELSVPTLTLPSLFYFLFCRMRSFFSCFFFFNVVF